MLSFFRKRADSQAAEALKKASKFKKAGKLDAAIAQLERFRRLASSGSVSYPIEDFLRLPLYMQTAGHREESWAEFYRLLEYGYPHRPQHPGLVAMENSTICDKMRLFLQRDGNPKLAFTFECLSLAWSLRGARYNADVDPEGLVALSERLRPENLSQALSSAAKKGGCQEIIPAVVDLLQQLPPTFDVAGFEKKLKGI